MFKNGYWILTFSSSLVGNFIGGFLCTSKRLQTYNMGPHMYVMIISRENFLSIIHTLTREASYFDKEDGMYWTCLFSINIYAEAWTGVYPHNHVWSTYTDRTEYSN